MVVKSCMWVSLWKWKKNNEKYDWVKEKFDVLFYFLNEG